VAARCCHKALSPHGYSTASLAVLPAGHAINGVIDDNRRQVNVAARGMDKMVAANRQRVAIAHHHDDFELRLREFQPSGKRQRAPWVVCMVLKSGTPTSVLRSRCQRSRQPRPSPAPPIHSADERPITMPMPHPLHHTLGNFLFVSDSYELMLFS